MLITRGILCYACDIRHRVCKGLRLGNLRGMQLLGERWNSHVGETGKALRTSFGQNQHTIIGNDANQPVAIHFNNYTLF